MEVDEGQTMPVPSVEGECIFGEKREPHVASVDPMSDD